jgi:hypothetical protein
VKGAEVHRQLAAQCKQNCLPQRTLYEWIEMFKSSRTSAADADTSKRPSTSTNEQNMERDQAKIIETSKVTIAPHSFRPQKMHYNSFLVLGENL